GRHALPAAGLVAIHPRPRAVHLRAGERPPRELPAQAGQAGLRRIDYRRREVGGRRRRHGKGRPLRRGGADRGAERPGVDLVPAAPAARRLQPRRAARRHDGDGRPRLAGRGREASRGARRQAVLRGSRLAAQMTVVTMVKWVLLCGLCGQIGLAATAAAAPPVRTMYTDVLLRERAVRDAMAADDASAALLDDVRAVVASYEAVIRQYPLSGYSDNALWQAGRLALDAFTQFGQPKDRDTGVRLLRRLVTSYQASRLVPQVSAELARVESPSPAAAAKIATIQQIRRTILPDAVRITIELDGEVQFRDQRIADPSRVFVDLSGTRAAPGLVDRTLRFEND